GGQGGMRLVGRFLDQRGKIELAAIDGFCDGLERANFRRGEAGARESGRTRAQHRRVVERVEVLVEPRPDRFRARGRELLRDDDRGKAGKSVRPSPQRRPPRPRQHDAEAWIGVDETGDRVIEIGFGVDEEGHDRGEASTNAIATQPLSRAGTTRARMSTPVFRFAPSPNGYLHVGHALSALVNFEMARAAGGRFLLRIEDIDAARCRPQYEAAIYEDLGCFGVPGGAPGRRKTAHLDASRAALARLGGLVSPSFESRGEIARLVAEREMHAPWPRDPDGAPLSPGDARSLSPAERQRRLAAGGTYSLPPALTAGGAPNRPPTWSRTRRGGGKPT